MHTRTLIYLYAPQIFPYFKFRIFYNNLTIKLSQLSKLYATVSLRFLKYVQGEKQT